MIQVRCIWSGWYDDCLFVCLSVTLLSELISFPPFAFVPPLSLSLSYLCVFWTRACENSINKQNAVRRRIINANSERSLNAGISSHSTTPTPTPTPTRPTRLHHYVRHARLKLFLWQAERHADILATILARMSARMGAWGQHWLSLKAKA